MSWGLISVRGNGQGTSVVAPDAEERLAVWFTDAFGDCKVLGFEFIQGFLDSGCSDHVVAGDGVDRHRALVLPQVLLSLLECVHVADSVDGAAAAPRR